MLSGPGGRQGRAAAGAGAQGEGKGASKLLDQFGRNLTKLATLSPSWTRWSAETEIERIPYGSSRAAEQPGADRRAGRGDKMAVVEASPS